jgi:uncharacterized protein YkwD
MKNVKYLEVEVSPFSFVQREDKNFCLRELEKKYPAKTETRKPARKFLSTFFKVGIFSLLFLFPLTDSAQNNDLTPSGIIQLTNYERKDFGLDKLKNNEELTLAAYNKAQDMIVKGYFDHLSPDNKKPWDFIKEAGYQYSTAAENLAIDFFNPEDIVKSWMNSEAHKSNILDPGFNDIGVAVLSGNIENKTTTIVVEMFGREKENKASEQKDSSSETAFSYPQKL